nr:Wings apart-like protein [Ipomoea batatas]GMD10252.1 Wings apart-like protein [Ipomoea batatas]
MIKLLKPVKSDVSVAKPQTIGSKLLAIRLDADISQDLAKGTDSTTNSIMLKVQEVLVNCKEMKPMGDNNRAQKPELNPKWISLLTMEKACLSTISIEDTSGSVRKSGGTFKEKLRELGGLDAVFEVARNCHSVLEGCLEEKSSSFLDSKGTTGLESLVLLLKCLKIMENATFLSMDNQVRRL